MTLITKKENKNVRMGVMHILGERHWFRGNDTAVQRAIDLYNGNRHTTIWPC